MTAQQVYERIRVATGSARRDPQFACFGGRCAGCGGAL